MGNSNRIRAIAILFSLACVLAGSGLSTPGAAVAKPVTKQAPQRAHDRKAKARRHHRRAARRRGLVRPRGQLDRKQGVRKAVALTSASAAPSDPDLLFKGTHIGDFAMNQSAPGAVTEVADPAGSGESVLDMTVSDQDVAPVTPTENPRAQLLSPSVINPGDEFWWSSKFFLPADFPSSVPGWLTVMEGPYGPPFDGTPPWHLEVNGSQIQWSRNSTYDWDVPWQMPLIRGSWVNVLMHAQFSSDGFVEMWVNGRQVTFFEGGTFNPDHEAPTSRLEMQTMDASNSGGANFAVIQSYRKIGMFQSVSLLQGPMTLGRTRASVGA